IIQNAELGIESCRHLIALINDILDISKIEEGKVDLQIEKIALSSMFDTIYSTMNHMVEQKKLKLDIICGEPALNVLADRKRLDQILYNIVGNAIKFTDKGTITISYNQKDENTAQIEVIDTGCGIASDEIHKVFNRFEQAGTKAKQTKGTGLGMAISKKLVEMMGGEIEVKSELNKGTGFYFPLPKSKI
ncbi:MAG: HAMP domain-containing histidine kinase, partial [Desulfamplus sp.]|nr:HAMP domain-containing histidine kinase [Desulfamplus sp.]